jgi:hypothetical protein
MRSAEAVLHHEPLRDRVLSASRVGHGHAPTRPRQAQAGALPEPAEPTEASVVIASSEGLKLAPNTVDHRPGRAARTVQWLFTSRAHLALFIAREIGLAACRLPLWAHLLLRVRVHILVGGAA